MTTGGSWPPPGRAAKFVGGRAAPVGLRVRVSNIASVVTPRELIHFFLKDCGHSLVCTPERQISQTGVAILEFANETATHAALRLTGASLHNQVIQVEVAGAPERRMHHEPPPAWSREPPPRFQQHPKSRQPQYHDRSLPRGRSGSRGDLRRPSPPRPPPPPRSHRVPDPSPADLMTDEKDPARQDVVDPVFARRWAAIGRWEQIDALRQRLRRIASDVDAARHSVMRAELATQGNEFQSVLESIRLRDLDKQLEALAR
ncbi:RRM domain-containing protein [Plasmodiophora brassicae]